MKKFFINICLVLIAFVIYFLQSNFFNWFSIGGVKPNLFIIYILWIGLFGNKTMGVIYGMITGTFLDLLFYEKVGTNLIALTLIGIIAIIFNKNFFISCFTGISKPLSEHLFIEYNKIYSDFSINNIIGIF